MLGKLIKHEFKGTLGMCGLMVALIAIVSLVAAVGFAVPINMMINNSRALQNDSVSTVMVLTLTASLILYVFTLVGVTYGLRIYLGVRFYKSMYSNEGYLTQTLPVTQHQLLISKTLVAAVWQIVETVAVFLSIAGLVVMVVNILLTERYGVWSWSELFQNMIDMFGEEFGLGSVNYLTIVLLLITEPISGILLLFGSLTIGQLSGKHKALTGILTYFGMMIARMVLSNILQFIFTFSTLMTTDGNYSSLGMTYSSSLILSIGVGCAMYFISHYILCRKLNLE